MSGKKLTGLCLLFGILLAKGPASRTPHQSLPDEEHTIWDGNTISNVHGNHGDFTSYHMTGEGGLEWPKGEDTRAVFTSGLWIAAGKVNGVDDLRVSVAEYVSQFVPGKIDGDDGHIYRMHKVEIDAFLNNDWATYSTMTLMLPETIIDGSNVYTQLTETALPTADFMNWPVDMGAPWIDGNGDGVYNPPDGDYPDIKGDMYHWYVMNGADSLAHAFYWEGEPMDIEVEVAVYGFNAQGPLSNTLFWEWTITNAGTDTLDSTFVGFWADMDIGDHGDDFIGVDTTVDMIYSYNNEHDYYYEDTPPAVGQIILQTPIIPSVGDIAVVNGEEILDYANIPIYASVYYRGNNPDLNDPESPEHIYYYLNGLKVPSGDPYLEPDGNESRFVFTGNPYTGEGWIDSWVGDNRQISSMGPFQMLPGESQQIVAALLISRGMTNLHSVAALLAEAPIIIDAWGNGFNNILFYPEMGLIESPPENSESTGPFDFAFTIMDTSGYWSGDKLLLYTIDDIEMVYTVPLVHDSANVYSATVDGFDDYSGDHEFHYYIEVYSQDSTTAAWPLGAPYNMMSFLFGPDITAPVIVESDSLGDVHYLLPMEDHFSVSLYDERFGIGSVDFHYVDNDGVVHSFPLEFEDYLYGENWPNGYDEVWGGIVSGLFDVWGDTVYYWISASDSSMSQNEVISSEKYFTSTKSVTIGNWESGDLDDWQLGIFCYLTTFNIDGLLNWDETMSMFAGASTGAYGDTLTYLRSLDLSLINELWLQVPMLYSMESGNIRSIEISTDNINWLPLDTLDLVRNTPHYLNYPLHDYAGQNNVHLRFRGVRGSATLDWYIDDIILHSDSTLLDINDDIQLPSHFTLHQNYPNPFNPVTTIRYDLPIQTEAKLTIYNVLGQEVDILVNGKLVAGEHRTVWDATNVASGIYFYRLETPQKQITKKLVVLK